MDRAVYTALIMSTSDSTDLHAFPTIAFERRRQVGRRGGDHLQDLATSRSAVQATPRDRRVLACTSSNSRTFSMAITAWSAKVCTRAISQVGEGGAPPPRTRGSRTDGPCPAGAAAPVRLARTPQRAGASRRRQVRLGHERRGAGRCTMAPSTDCAPGDEFVPGAGYRKGRRELRRGALQGEAVAGSGVSPATARMGVALHADGSTARSVPRGRWPRSPRWCPAPAAGRRPSG